ncbi:MAG: formylglycine-generating enzyme family protein [Geminicoccaceae bacterium]|nr:formylglycine-generating enzyme family protein [Geminicoccaceae bacterium]
MRIGGGRVAVGTRKPMFPGDGEGPPRFVRIRDFFIEDVTVTNRRFASFVDETGYETDSERFGWSFVFVGLLPDGFPPTTAAVQVPWWRRVDGASWKRPLGPGSDVAGVMEHPVTHVSWNDAMAFAGWAGGRLLGEAEWEVAARGGLADPVYPWGDRAPDDVGFLPCNIWQGRFPYENSAADGWVATAPVRSFEPNGLGLYNMVGNVWEWCADSFRVRSLSRTGRKRDAEARAEGERLMKGGSFMCHDSYCHRYRIAARTGRSPDSAASHTGFRIGYDAG